MALGTLLVPLPLGLPVGLTTGQYRSDVALGSFEVVLLGFGLDVTRGVLVVFGGLGFPDGLEVFDGLGRVFGRLGVVFEGLLPPRPFEAFPLARGTRSTPVEVS